MALARLMQAASLHACWWQASFLRTAATLLVFATACAAPRTTWAQLGAKPSSIIVDARSGNVLEAHLPDEKRFPASLTKMMTLYETFEALRSRRITLDHLVPVSAHAASMEPTKLWLKPGTRITVEQCILGMVTVSANDAAVAMGELLGGSEYRFSQAMTRTAHRLGMSGTVFRNASGLPNPAQVTNARDMATLARALIGDFPQYYHYFSIGSFAFHGRTIYGHDPLLGAYDGVDGLKTGYTSAAGFNLATSAVRHGVRVVGIVLGAPSSPQRNATMVSLLDRGFARYGDLPQLARSGPNMGVPRLIGVAEAAERIEPPQAMAHHSPPRGYGVQVGTFAAQRDALRAVRVTVGTVGGVAHVQRFVVHHKPMWRGRVVSLTRAGAQRACPVKARKAHQCFIFREPG
jgi:D-alanyl-D-alanine carboxypeptidase